MFQLKVCSRPGQVEPAGPSTLVLPGSSTKAVAKCGLSRKAHNESDVKLLMSDRLFFLSSAWS